MHFLTEEDIRVRCPQPGSTLTLASNERLTPSASEFANGMRISIVKGDAPASCDSAPCAAEACAPACAAPEAACAPAPCSTAEGACCESMTHLDATCMVPKSHPRIVLRGKLDTLLAYTVLVQTQFDPKDRLSPYLKECLANIADWVMQVLAAEVSGGVMNACAMGGMDVDTLHAISRDPKKYLGLDPFMPSVAMGGNAALLNWLRALVRETEVAAAQSGLNRADIGNALNRLSSAVYVLVLLTLAAEKGMDVAKLGSGK